MVESGTTLRVQRATRPLSDLGPLERFAAKMLYAVDGAAGDATPTTDPEALAAAAGAAVGAGGGHGRDETAGGFPNGAGTPTM